jgi:hypothetical protein
MTLVIQAAFACSWNVWAAESMVQRDAKSLSDYFNEVEKLCSGESEQVKKALDILDEMEPLARKDDEWPLYVQ